MQQTGLKIKFYIQKERNNLSEVSVFIWIGAIQMWEAPNLETTVLSYTNIEIINHAKFHLPRRNTRQSCLTIMYWTFSRKVTVCNSTHSRDFSLCLGNNSSLFIPEFTAATLMVRLKSKALSYNRGLQNISLLRNREPV